MKDIMEDVDFSILKGKILLKVDGGKVDDEEIFFTTTEGEIYTLFYEHDCCASCGIVDIAGDLNDLIGVPILLAEEVINKNENPSGLDIPEFQESFTWTFYKLVTIKGFVTISWYV